MKLHVKEYLKNVRGLTEKEAPTIKRRMCFFVILTALIASISTILYGYFLPYKVSPHDIRMILFYLAMSGVFLLILNKIRNILISKLFMFFFIAVFSSAIAYDSIVTNVSFPDFLIAYIMILLSFSLIIPWIPPEVLIIGLITIGIFTVHFYSGAIFGIKLEGTSTANYISAVITLLISLFICLLARSYSTKEEIAKFKLNKELGEKNKQMDNELNLAKNVHARLVPKSCSTHLADIAVMYLPSYYMSGDYAKFNIVDKTNLLFFICDVTGHGVSAALLVNSLHAELDTIVSATHRPGELLKALNNIICEDFANTHMYLTAFCGLLDYRHKKLYYSNYGHIPQYIYRVKKAAIEPLSAQTSFIGLAAENTTIYETEIAFERKDQIILFTDGVMEARDRLKKEYGLKRIEEFISNNHELDVKVFNANLLNDLRVYSNNSFQDDIFILNIKTK